MVGMDIVQRLVKRKRERKAHNVGSYNFPRKTLFPQPKDDDECFSAPESPPCEWGLLPKGELCFLNIIGKALRGRSPQPPQGKQSERANAHGATR